MTEQSAPAKVTDIYSFSRVVNPVPDSNVMDKAASVLVNAVIVGV